MRLIKSKSDTIHKLEIPRNQFDRIADAFEATVIDVNGFDFEKDTVIFSITENQRKKFEKYINLGGWNWGHSYEHMIKDLIEDEALTEFAFKCSASIESAAKCSLSITSSAILLPSIPSACI